MAHKTTLTEQLKYMSDTELKMSLEKLKLDENPSRTKKLLITSVEDEIRERVSHEALCELNEMHSNSVIDYIKALRAQKPMNPAQRIQYSVANELLIDRHPDLATRADLYTSNNPISNWDAVFFGLITDIDNH